MYSFIGTNYVVVMSSYFLKYLQCKGHDFRAWKQDGQAGCDVYSKLLVSLVSASSIQVDRQDRSSSCVTSPSEENWINLSNTNIYTLMLPTKLAQLMLMLMEKGCSGEPVANEPR